MCYITRCALYLHMISYSGILPLTKMYLIGYRPLIKSEIGGQDVYIRNPLFGPGGILLCGLIGYGFQDFHIYRS